MNREELEQVIYDRTRNFVDGRVMDCIFELIAEEREACCKIVHGQCESDNVAQRTVDAIRARGEE